MDLVEVIRQVARVFIQYCNITFKLGGFTVSVASCFIFAGLVVLIISFIRGLAD